MTRSPMHMPMAAGQSKSAKLFASPANLLAGDSTSATDPERSPQLSNETSDETPVVYRDYTSLREVAKERGCPKGGTKQR